MAFPWHQLALASTGVDAYLSSSLGEGMILIFCQS
jgi:hypothetical protein